MILGFQRRHEQAVYANNGEQAVNEIKSAIDQNDPFRFSLILMDCSMPFLDGYEATKIIRNLFFGIDITRESQPKIVAITGHVEKEYIEKAYQSGMDKVFSKPMPIKEFAKLLFDMKKIENIP